MASLPAGPTSPLARPLRRRQHLHHLDTPVGGADPPEDLRNVAERPPPGHLWQLSAAYTIGDGHLEIYAPAGQNPRPRPPSASPAVPPGPRPRCTSGEQSP
jgi:hypothetical protein